MTTATVVRRNATALERLGGRARFRFIFEDDPDAIFADDPEAATGWPHSGHVKDCPNLPSGTRTVDPQTGQVRAAMVAPRIQLL
jgi:hypothetical protein